MIYSRNDCSAPGALHQIRSAQSGTVLLGRVGNLPLDEQPMLLRLLNEAGFDNRLITGSTEDLTHPYSRDCF